MKLLINLFMLLTLVSCGLAQDISKSCGADAEVACDVIFGGNDRRQDEQIEKNTKEIDALKLRLTALEVSVDSNLVLLQTLTQQLEDTDEDLQDQIDQLRNDINIAQSNYNASLISMSNTIATLEGSLNNSISQIINPCGDAAGFDEVILKTRGGEFLAYFESGSKRFLTKLSNGSYTTTDGTSCTFHVSGSNLTW